MNQIFASLLRCGRLINGSFGTLVGLLWVDRSFSPFLVTFRKIKRTLCRRFHFQKASLSKSFFALRQIQKKVPPFVLGLTIRAPDRACKAASFRDVSLFSGSPASRCSKASRKKWRHRKIMNHSWNDAVYRGLLLVGGAVLGWCRAFVFAENADERAAPPITNLGCHFVYFQIRLQ